MVVADRNTAGAEETLFLMEAPPDITARERDAGWWSAPSAACPWVQV